MSYVHGDLLNAAGNTQSRQSSSMNPDRDRVMQQLGLNPDTQVDGLKTIFRYASSATALRPHRLEALLRAQQG